MKITPPTILLILLLFASCKFKPILSLNNEEDLVEIQQIINKNYDTESLVYELGLYGSALSSALDNIHRVYKVKDIYFKDDFWVKDNKFTDPKKAIKPLQSQKSFKIKEIDVTLIAVKYKEALQLLEDKKLIEKGATFPLTSWVYKKDEKGGIWASFSLHYYVHSSKHGRQRTTTYGSYDFEMNSDQTLKLLN